MENKKILFIADGCHPGTQGGIQTFGRALQKMFGNDLIFLTNNTKNKKIFKVDNVIEISKESLIFKILNKLLKNKLRENKIKREIKKINPDICILRSPQNLKVLKGVNCKKILVQHTRIDNYFKYYYKNSNKLLDYSKKVLNYFVVTSKYDKIRLNKEYNFPIEKIRVIRHSCELDLLNKKKKSNKNLIMIARLDNRSKRFDLAIKAMKKLKNFNLKIYGSGPDQDILKKLIEKEKIKNVFLCGTTNKIKEKLDKAGIFVMTSDVEGYPITSIEAMRRGLPIIIRNTFEGAEDIVIDNGILLEKEWDENKFIAGINEIYNNYDEYSKNSLEMGKRHNFDIIKKNWEKIFYE